MPLEIIWIIQQLERESANGPLLSWHEVLSYEGRVQSLRHHSAMFRMNRSGAHGGRIPVTA